MNPPPVRNNVSLFKYPLSRLSLSGVTSNHSCGGRTESGGDGLQMDGEIHLDKGGKQN